jgi:hypothetical protein
MDIPVPVWQGLGPCRDFLNALNRAAHLNQCFGQIRTSALLWKDEKGDWTELHEITIGSQPPKKYMELRVSRRK